MLTNKIDLLYMPPRFVPGRCVSYLGSVTALPRSLGVAHRALSRQIRETDGSGGLSYVVRDSLILSHHRSLEGNSVKNTAGFGGGSF